MSLTDLAALASVFSSLAVAVSLVYLAWQLRQAAKHQRGEIGHGRTEHVQALVSFVSDPAFKETVLRGWAGDATLEPVRVNQFYWYAYVIFVTFENTWHQNRARMIEPRVYATACAQMRSHAAFPGTRAAWPIMRERFEPGFRGFIDAMVAETQPVVGGDVAAAWTALATGRCGL